MNTLRPVRFNERAALSALADVHPKPVRNAVERVLLAALNPDEAFGDEYLNLVVAGNVLHGLVTRRDVGEMPRLDGVRIVLDTSVLVDLVSGSGPEAASIEETIRLSSALGAEVIVPQHTVDEWISLFDAATGEIGDAAYDPTKLAAFGPIASNVFVSRFLSRTQDQETLTWSAFARQWRDPTKELAKRGITIRDHHNDQPEDRTLVDAVRAELRKVNRARATEPGRRLRTGDAIDADANTVAMLARWRKRSGPDSAYFVARDRMTAEAYRALRPTDRFSLVVTVPAWLMLVGSLTIDDPTQRAEVAMIIGNSAIRDSFLSLAACYPFDEIAALSAALSQDPEPPSPDDVTLFVQQTLDGFELEVKRSDRVADARFRGGQLLSKRAGRRNQRAQRARAGVEHTIAEQVEKVRQQALVTQQAQAMDAQREISAERDKAEQLQTALDSAREGRARMKRAIAALILSALVSLTVAVLWTRGGLDHHYLKQRVFAGGVLAVIAMVVYVTSGLRKASIWAVGMVAIPVLTGFVHNTK